MIYGNQEPSPSWRRTTKPEPAIDESPHSPQLRMACSKIAQFAVSHGVTMWEVLDYLRTEMVYAGSAGLPYGKKSQAMRDLGVSRNALYRVRRRG